MGLQCIRAKCLHVRVYMAGIVHSRGEIIDQWVSVQPVPVTLCHLVSLGPYIIGPGAVGGVGPRGDCGHAADTLAPDSFTWEVGHNDSCSMATVNPFPGCLFVQKAA